MGQLESSGPTSLTPGKDSNGCLYTYMWNAYMIMTHGLPMANRETLFHDDAVKFYRM